MKLKKSGRLSLDFKAGPRAVTYHMPCHLKAQNVGYRTKEVLELIPGMEAGDDRDAARHTTGRGP